MIVTVIIKMRKSSGFLLKIHVSVSCSFIRLVFHLSGGRNSWLLLNFILLPHVSVS